MTAPTLINLSNQYINVDTIASLHQQYLPLYTQLPPHSPGLPSALSFSSTIFPSLASSLSTLQSFLSLLSPSLTSLNCAHSNITGRLFFRGRTLDFPPSDADTAQIFIEGREHSPPHRFIVRDDDPPLLLRDPPTPSTPSPPTYRYVSTAYHDTSHTFTRTYAELGWLSLREVDLSSTDLSSHGLQSLLCCTGQSLQVLKLNDCPQIDSTGVFTLTALCRHLHTLELNHCPLLTEHAFMALADMPPPSLSSLSALSVCHPTLPPVLFSALLNALQDRGFQGLFTCGYSHSPLRQIRATATPLIPRLSAGTVQDLTLTDLTHSVLKLLSPHQQQFLIDQKLALIHRWTPDQQRAYHRMIGTRGAPPAGLVHSLDLSQHYYINDALLRHILQQYGASLFVLKLSHTFVTSHGLSALSLCPHLRVLSMLSCHSLHDKQAANATMMDVIKGMPELMELNISDSRLSGRMLSKHPALALFTFFAHACPISSRAVRLLSESCAQSLSVLSLSRCPFINVQAMYYVMRMLQLRELDVSFCQALSAKDVAVLEEFQGLEIRKINISGVHGVTAELCRRIADRLTRRKTESGVDGVNVVVIGSDKGSFTPTGASALSSPSHLSSARDFNYAVVQPQLNAATQNRVREELARVMMEAQVKEEKERHDAPERRYHGVHEGGAITPSAAPPSPNSGEGLYTVMPTVEVEEDSDGILPRSALPAHPQHLHTQSLSGTLRPANPTPPSASTHQWHPLTSKVHSHTLPSHLPSSTVSSAASSSAASPLIMASTPSASSSTSHHRGPPPSLRPHLPPHVSLPASPLGAAPAFNELPPPLMAQRGEDSMSRPPVPPSFSYTPITDTTADDSQRA